MDNFSPSELRQLSLIERDLVTDRRLVALMAVLGARGSRTWRRLRCLAVRLRFACRIRGRRPRT
ncbi:MAG TPA: hypothetical protein VJX10_20495 [Pseudonocardiaceae bacterium]|nr:hypothetical protein [Pseudonocardiaceae bacterium]